MTVNVKAMPKVETAAYPGAGMSSSTIEPVCDSDRHSLTPSSALVHRTASERLE